MFYTLFLAFLTLCGCAASANDPGDIYASDMFSNDELSSQVLIRRIRESEQISTEVLPNATLPPSVDQQFNATGLNITYDDHIYYKSKVHIGASELTDWFDLDASNHTVKHELLSTSHRKATTIKLSFEFPFYGQVLKQVTIATGGFLYVGTFLHNWLAATQYIAPFMANFDPSLANTSHIQYADTGDSFVVQWTNMILRDQRDVGEFTFQAILKQNGDIIMNYLKVPLVPLDVHFTNHPVKVGLSDAFVLQSQLRLFRKTHKRNTIYEYHRVDFKSTNLTDSSYIYLTALPTCLQSTNCSSCLAADIGYDCYWCESMQRCSSGTDRKRQEWLSSSCGLHAVNETCPAPNATVPTVVPATLNVTSLNDTNTTLPVTKVTTTLKPFIKITTLSSNDSKVKVSKPTTPYNSSYSGLSDKGKRIRDDGVEKKSGVANVAAILIAIIVVVLIVTIVLWFVYAYKNPHTASGQLLIKYRPSQWRSHSNSSARYSASSMHI